MWQWSDFPTAIRDIILEYIDDDTLREQNLSSVSTERREIIPGNQPRRQVGTIILRPQIRLFGQVDMDRGLTIATLFKLAHHYMEWVISPDQYDRVVIVPNIRDYRRIRHSLDREFLEGSLQAQYIDPGVPLVYNNITAIDCHDNTDDLVTENWDSREMNLVDLFYPCIHYGVHTVHFTFVAILLARFFQNVTSINLSATVWSTHALNSIQWIMLEKLIWNKCLCFDLFLPHLGTAANLL